MGALVDSLRDAVADGKTDNKDEAIDNIKETLQLASRRLLNSAKNGDAELDQDDLLSLSSDDVGKMVANQFKKQNSINYNGDTNAEVKEA